jgi:hypothetical protein
MARPIVTLLTPLLLAIAATPQLAHADGMPFCRNSCDAGSTADGLSVGTGLVMMGAVAYLIGRKRRR